MPVQDNTPPFSRHRARDCTAGAFETLANNSLAAAIVKSCAKQGQGRRRTKASQGAKPKAANAWDLPYKSPVPELSRFFGINRRLLVDWERLQGGERPLPIEPLR